MGTRWTEDQDVSRIEAQAEHVLKSVASYIWDGTTLPVPVEDIADSHFGLLVRDVESLSAAPGAPALEDGLRLSGLLLPDLAEIWVSAREAAEWPTRRRFTIAHELGHWQLHRGRTARVFCRSSVIREDLAEGGAQPRDHEWEANVFAATVLMPAAQLREQYVSCDRDFRRLCTRFGASGAAMGRRLHAVVPPGT